MKTTLSLLMLFALFSLNANPQDYTQWGLPDGAIARLDKGEISEIAYSPDGARLAVASSIGIWLYDTATYQEVALLTGHTDWVWSVAFSPDGGTLASGSGDGTVRLWDALTGAHLRILEGHTDWVRSVAFSPDGGTLASGSGDGTVRLWDALTGAHLRTLEGHTGWVYSVAFSPDGGTLASGSGDGTVRLWDALTGAHLRTLEGHWGSVYSVAFSPDGRTLASGSFDDSVLLWDALTGAALRILRHRGSVYSVAFSPDGGTLASGSGDDTVRLWDALTGAHLRALEGHWGSVYSVAFSPDGGTLASGSDDDTVRLWDALTGAHLRILRHRGWVYSVAFSPDGGTLASGSEDDTVRLWDALTGAHLRTLEGHTDSVRSVAFSPDGRTLASGSGDGTVRLWDAVTGAHLRTLEGHWGSVYSVAFSPDGRTLASGSYDGTVRLWDALTGAHLRTLEGHTDSVRSVAFSPDGRTLASGSFYHTVRLWDAVTGAHLRTLKGHWGSVYSVAFSPDGRTLASGSGDGTVRLWDALTGAHKRTLEGHTDDVESVAFSPDGRALASGSYDGTVRLWDAVTGAHLRTLEGHWGPVYSAAFSPDGGTLASGSTTVLLWEFYWEFYAFPKVKIAPSSVESPAIGEQFTVSITVANGANMAGYQATMEFDAFALRYVSSANGDYLPAGAFAVPAVVSSNQATLGATSLAGVGSGDGILATFTFEVVNVETSRLFLSEIIVTDSNGEPLSDFANLTNAIVMPTAVPSSAIVSVKPALALSPAIGEQLVLNVEIVGGQNVADYQLTWQFDSTALEYISSNPGDYVPAGGVGNGDGRLETRTFEVRAVKASTVSVFGFLKAPNGIRSIPTFESAEVIVPLLGDVNRDGAVNILDLVLVASSFGKPVPQGGDPADVNEDGVVNIIDLVKVAGALGNAAAAPYAFPGALAMLDTTAVQAWLIQARGLAITDATSQRGILFLEQLLAVLTPKETSLLPNYPNPFNPETWIPYHLAIDADVQITIYDAKGVLVRQLDLGHQPAGFYTDRGHAAYWDGRNEGGELVASGVYVYQLRAREYSQVRRMVIVK